MTQDLQQKALSLAKLRISAAHDQKLTSLNLVRLGLTALPNELWEAIVKIENLQSIDLSGNAFEQLPVILGQLRGLQALILRGNPLTSLPISLTQLTHLKLLDINATQITTLPAEIEQWIEQQTIMLIREEDRLSAESNSDEILRSDAPPEITRSGGRLSKGIWEDTSEETQFETMRGELSGISGEPEVSTDFSHINDLIEERKHLAMRSQLEISASVTSTTQTRSLTKDWINAGVFSPKQVKRENPFLVQVFAYLPEQIDEVREEAAMVDETAEQVAKKKLGVQVQRETDLTFELVMPGVEIDEPVQSFTWQGWQSSVEFGVTVPEDFEVPDTGKRVLGTVTVSQASVPIGHLKFRVMVVPEGVAVKGEPELAGEDATAYKKVFVSYSSDDRAEVLKRVQAIKLTSDMEVFQDLLSLNPGDRWEKELYKNIDSCDLFLLFWSQSAKASKWVLKEVLYALDLQNELKLPEIKPVILEGPPIVRPPKELGAIHFNDQMIYFINQS